MAKQDSPAKYRCLANILTPGKDPDFFKDRIYNLEELKTLPKEKIAKKFQKLEAVQIVQGTDEELIKQNEKLLLENQLLQNEVDRLKGDAKPVTTKTGGQKGNK